jgi:site-specific recombinase XerD
VLTSQGVKFFRSLTAGRPPTELILKRDDGMHWGKSHQDRRLRDAAARAGLSPDTVFYSLRHTYAPHCLAAGMNMQLLAENMGTSVRMIEKHYGKFAAQARRQLIEDAAPRYEIGDSSVVPLARL